MIRESGDAKATCQGIWQVGKRALGAEALGERGHDAPGAVRPVGDDRPRRPGRRVMAAPERDTGVVALELHDVGEPCNQNPRPYRRVSIGWSLRGATSSDHLAARSDRRTAPARSADVGNGRVDPAVAGHAPGGATRSCAASPRLGSRSQRRPGNSSERRNSVRSSLPARTPAASPIRGTQHRSLARRSGEHHVTAVAVGESAARRKASRNRRGRPGSPRCRPAGGLARAGRSQ